MYFPARARKLLDSRNHGAGCELFLVEGDSASSSVEQVRDPQFQAVLPMQGKPMNAIKATAQKVQSNDLYAALIQSLGASWGKEFSLNSLRFERIYLLMDPDPDGMHCGFLLQMFFFRWYRPIIDTGRLHTIWAPMAEVHVKNTANPHYAYSEPHLGTLRRRLEAEGAEIQEIIRHRGLASLGSPLLKKTCVHPATRASAAVTAEDAKKAIQTFCPEAMPEESSQMDLF